MELNDGYDNVLVSAILITYNQEKYVAQAVESMLNQETNFKYEILVGDDCSTDNTPKILQEYNDRHPDKIKLFLRETNLGGTHNAYLLKKEAKGKYLTLLEGDDYWIGKNRLQYLVDFLEQNPKYIGIGHRRERRDTQGNFLSYDPLCSVLNKRFTVGDFLKGKRYSMSGSLFKNYYPGSNDKYKKILLNSRHVGDYQTCMIALDMGPIYITDQCFGVHRVRRKGEKDSNYNSITTPLDRYYDHINLIKGVDDFFSHKYDFTLERVNLHIGAILFSIKQKDLGEVGKILAEASMKEQLLILPIVLRKVFIKYLRNKGCKKKKIICI